MGILKDFINKLVPEGDGSVDSNYGSKVTNKVLYKELIAHFEADMEELSVARRVLYTMSFNILMHHDDYARVGASLPFVLPEVVAGFYAAIKRKRDSIAGSDCTPPAKYWFFQIAASRVKTENGVESFIRQGEIVTVGSLFTLDVKKSRTMVDTNVRLSVKCQNSNINDNNINQAALLNMDILSDGVYTFNFDKNLSESLGDIESSRRNDGLGDGTVSMSDAKATISYTNAEGNTVHYFMTENSVIVSGPSDPRDNDNILKVDCEEVATSHIEIRYIKEAKRFQLCAYAKTRLNMREVPLSKGGDVIWKDVSLKSEIFLNDALNLKFKANDSLN